MAWKQYFSSTKARKRWMGSRVSFGTTHIAHGFTGERLGLQVSKNTKNLSWNLPRLLCEAFLFLAFQWNFRHFHKHFQVTLFSCNRWEIGCVSEKKIVEIHEKLYGFPSIETCDIFHLLKSFRLSKNPVWLFDSYLDLHVTIIDKRELSFHSNCVSFVY